MFDANAGVATQVSAPGMPIGSGTATSSAAPGAAGPASSMSVSHACLVLILGAGAALVAIGIVFRRPIGEA
jgi:hypothetical protein